MAVPSPPSLSAVCTEFGAPSNTPLSSFLRGGAYVPNGPSANASVPTSLPIALSQLAGAVKYSFTASASPSSLSGASSTSPVGTSGSSTCSTSGATGTVTYSWSVTTTSGPTITAINSTSATTGFRASMNNLNNAATGSATCTAHDGGGGGNATTNTVTINLSYTGP